MTKNELSDILFLNGLEYFGKFYSFYNGICEEVDANNQNKIKVSCKEVYGNNNVHDLWALPLATVMTEHFFVINPPKKGEEVLLVFRKGNIRYPMYIRTAQRTSLIDKTQLLKQNNIEAKDLTIIINSIIADFSKEIKLINTDNHAAISPNVQGDILREQLEDLKKNQSDIVLELQNIITTLNSYITSSGSIISAILPPFASVTSIALTKLIKSSTELVKLKTTIESLDIDNNKSNILYNN